VFCAACGEPTTADPCVACGKPAMLDGRYRFDAVLGHGSMGTTWRAAAVADDRVVAIKEIPLRGIDDGKARELVLREARVLRQLHHVCIPAYVDSVVAGGGRHRTLFLVEEHIEGETLAQEMDRKRYTEDEVLAIVEEVIGILAYLHGLSPPVVHRDVKPGNVMRRTQDGRLVLIDFGAVRDVVKGELGGSTVAGTFGYMAPEQFQGDAVPSTDLFGVGALAVTMLTRREPQTMMDFTGRIRWRPYAKVKPATADFIDALIEPDVSLRIPSAGLALQRVRDARLAIAGPGGPLPVRMPIAVRTYPRLPPAAALANIEKANLQRDRGALALLTDVRAFIALGLTVGFATVGFSVMMFLLLVLSVALV
jgi:serine/threonine protein kinase